MQSQCLLSAIRLMIQKRYLLLVVLAILVLEPKILHCHSSDASASEGMNSEVQANSSLVQLQLSNTPFKHHHDRGVIQVPLRSKTYPSFDAEVSELAIRPRHNRRDLSHTPAKSFAVNPRGWRKTATGWEHASNWNLRSSLGEILIRIRERENHWLTHLVQWLGMVPPAIYAGLQLVLISGICCMPRLTPRLLGD